MKYFTVNVHYDFVATVEVLADDEDMAINKAEEIAENIDVEKLQCIGITDSCVTDIENID